MANKGGQPGNNNASKGRQATHALELMVKLIDEYGDEPIDWDKVEVVSSIKPLMRMWEHQVRNAMKDGDKGALTMIVERLDGRPRQAIDVGGQDENPLLAEVRRTIVDSGHRDS